MFRPLSLQLDGTSVVNIAWATEGKCIYTLEYRYLFRRRTSEIIVFLPKKATDDFLIKECKNVDVASVLTFLETYSQIVLVIAIVRIQ